MRPAKRKGAGRLRANAAMSRPSSPLAKVAPEGSRRSNAAKSRTMATDTLAKKARRTNNLRKADGTWSQWVLELSAKQRNKLLSNIYLDAKVQQQLKAASRKFKQRKSQREYAKRRRDAIRLSLSPSPPSSPCSSPRASLPLPVLFKPEPTTATARTTAGHATYATASPTAGHASYTVKHEHPPWLRPTAQAQPSAPVKFRQLQPYTPTPADTRLLQHDDFSHDHAGNTHTVCAQRCVRRRRPAAPGNDCGQ